MTKTRDSYDVLIVGGGVIGLSLAWELAQHDAKVCVIDKGPLGKEASWAGAGMIPAGPAEACWDKATEYEQLAGLSQQLHALWHQRLLELTGINNEYHCCGTIQLAVTSEDAQQLGNHVTRWQQLGIECNPLDEAALSDIEPIFNSQIPDCQRAFYLPGEAQLRNPRHLCALVAACQLAGVTLQQGVHVHQLETDGDQLTCAITSDGPIAADQFCLAAGSWTGQLTASLGVELPVKPIRGQIVMLAGPPGLIKRSINVGPRYLVPRRDGRLLIGATQEDVGFLKENTAAGVASLLEFAHSLAPQLSELPIETSWSGLRPGTADGLPYLGRLKHLKNAWLATGHFRAGLQLSTATAVVMRELILGSTPSISLDSFGIDR